MLQGEPSLRHAAGSREQHRSFTRGQVLLALALVGSVLALVCARYDLALSLALVDTSAPWARFAERYGELPGFFALAAAFLATFLRATTSSGTRLQRGLLCLAAAAAMTVALGVADYRLRGDVPGAPPSLAALALTFTLLQLWPARRGRAWAERVEVRRASRTTLWLALGSALFVHPLKLLWGRVRFRDLDAAHAAFSAWYLPQGPTGHASFPSGHTAMAWMLLPGVLLFAQGTRARLVSALLVFGWGSFVALGRVVIGAHYASDVLFATLFALAVVLWAASAAPASA
jgi:membrane-associated phospholipid phosphatase